MDEILEKYNGNSIQIIIVELFSEICSAIDDELYDVEVMVENGRYSPDEISNKIREIRKKIY